MAAGSTLRKPGKLAYENATHWLTHDTPGETLTRSMYQSLRYRYEDGDLFSEVTVEASPRAPDDEQVLWEPENEEQVAAGATTTITARLKYPAYSITGIIVSSRHARRHQHHGKRDMHPHGLCAARGTDVHQRQHDLCGAAVQAPSAGASRRGCAILEERRSSTAPFWAARTKRSR